MILPRKRALAMMMKIQKVMMNMKALHSYNMMYYALFRTNWQYQNAGYYWAAHPQWMCSATLNFLVTFEMRNVLLTLYCNAGKAIKNKKGVLKGYCTLWYYPEGIVNILSLHNLQKKHKDTYDSSQGTGFVVHKADGTRRIFMPSF